MQEAPSCAVTTARRGLMAGGSASTLGGCRRGVRILFRGFGGLGRSAHASAAGQGVCLATLSHEVPQIGIRRFPEGQDGVVHRDEVHLLCSSDGYLGHGFPAWTPSRQVWMRETRRKSIAQ